MVTPAPFNKLDKISVLGLNFGSGEFSLFWWRRGAGGGVLRENKTNCITYKKENRGSFGSSMYMRTSLRKIRIPTGFSFSL